MEMKSKRHLNVALSQVIISWRSLERNARDAAILKCDFVPIDRRCHKTVIYEHRDVDFCVNRRAGL
jgi:hypothetical protein